jgi:hypothetical protein
MREVDMKLIPCFLVKPFVAECQNIQNKNKPHLLDTTDVGYQARKEFDWAVRLELVLILPLCQLWHRRNEILYPNPAQYI